MDCPKLMDICQKLKISDHVIEMLKAEGLVDEITLAELTDKEIADTFPKIGERKQVQRLRDECKKHATEMHVAVRADPEVIIAGSSKTYSLWEIPNSDDELVQEEIKRCTGADFQSLLKDFEHMGQFLRVASYGTCAVVQLKLKIQALGFDVKTLGDETYVFVNSSITTYTEILHSYKTAYEYMATGEVQFALNQLSTTLELCLKMAKYAEDLGKSYDATAANAKSSLGFTTSEEGEKEQEEKKHRKDINDKAEELEQLTGKEKQHSSAAEEAEEKLKKIHSEMTEVKGKEQEKMKEQMKVIMERMESISITPEKVSERSVNASDVGLGTATAAAGGLALGTGAGIVGGAGLATAAAAGVATAGLAIIPIGIGVGLGCLYKWYSSRKDEREKKAAELKMFETQKGEKLEAVKRELKGLDDELHALQIQVEEQLKKAKEENDQKEKLIQNQLLLSQQLENVKDSESSARVGKDALHAAVSGLQRMAVVLMNMSAFWKLMSNHTETLMTTSGAAQNENIKALLGKPKDGVMESFNNPIFKREAFSIYIIFVALRTGCQEYLCYLNRARTAIDKVIVENPTTEEALSKVGQLAEEMKRDLQKEGSKLAEEKAVLLEIENGLKTK